MTTWSDIEEEIPLSDYKEWPDIADVPVSDYEEWAEADETVEEDIVVETVQEDEPMPGLMDHGDYSDDDESDDEYEEMVVVEDVDLSDDEDDLGPTPPSLSRQRPSGDDSDSDDDDDSCGPLSGAEFSRQQPRLL